MNKLLGLLMYVGSLSAGIDMNHPAEVIGVEYEWYGNDFYELILIRDLDTGMLYVYRTDHCSDALPLEDLLRILSTQEPLSYEEALDALDWIYIPRDRYGA